MKSSKKKIIVFTGAGMSEESGIKTFRDSNGLWHEHKVDDVATILLKTDDTLTPNFVRRTNDVINIFLNKGYQMENDEEKLGVRYVTLIDGTKINEDKFFEYYVEHGNSEEWRKRLSDYVTRPFKVVSNFRSGIAWNRNTTKQVINEAVNKQTITPNNFVYYKTEPINRESIINNGLYPLIDVKYEIKNKKKTTQLPGIIAINTDQKDNYINENINYDVWEIDSTKNDWFLAEDLNIKLSPENIINFEPVKKENLKLIHNAQIKQPINE